MPYWNPLRLPDGRRLNRQMADNGDFTIPLVLWLYILMFVADGDLWSAMDCRLVCRTFQNLIDYYNVYTFIDIGMNRFILKADALPPQQADPLAVFYQHCLDNRNPEAVFRHAITVLRDSSNVPLCMDYLRRACEGPSTGSEFSGFRESRLIPHNLSFYVLTMFNIIRGPEPVRSTSVSAMIRRLQDRPLWYYNETREEEHKWLDDLYPVSPELLSHIPMRGYPFLPPNRPCEEYGEWRYLRCGFEGMDSVNGDYTQGSCCYRCLCYVDAAAFCEGLRNNVPYIYTHPGEW